MKGTRVTLAALFLLTAAASAATAFAESIPYEFATVDIRVSGSSAGLIPEDINDRRRTSDKRQNQQPCRSRYR